MADPNAASQGPAKAAGSAGASGASQGNPVFRMMGLPNFRFKLPSRNWMIFLTITSSWTAALVYDRREKKRVQQKYCDAVAHLARETLPTTAMPRRMTIYLSAPPADGLMGAREHFHEYVKPILVAAAMDWDAVEGRREGDVRAQLAERIRKLRKQAGEATTEPLAEDDLETTIAQQRQRAGIQDWQGPQGDIVIGRNTWKEYVRGLHEGWLGPLDAPPAPEDEAVPATPSSPTPADDASPTAPPTPAATTTAAELTPEDAEKQAEKEPEQKKEEEQKQQPAKRTQPPPFISAADYASATLPPSAPQDLGPSAAVPYPHILGFLNTPVRMYRFLTRRRLADDIGAQVAAAVLAAQRPYAGPAESWAADEGVAPVGQGEDGDELWEVQRALRGEEKEWHKSVRKEAAAKREEGKESVWCDDMVLDPRVAGRMRRFVLEEGERARIGRIGKGEDGVRGEGEKEE
ncbi:mitochondrial import inner membrane translocase subunit tim54 [Neofusicoccum ribis]|uniref:Mitochondrial import inner membrane translocase subunit TIM54 n=1 Tax=Neofusicoccum ribis TaxID=45134 RepID=A0ABR3T5I3_9PEZI